MTYATDSRLGQSIKGEGRRLIGWANQSPRRATFDIVVGVPVSLRRIGSECRENGVKGYWWNATVPGRNGKDWTRAAFGDEAAAAMVEGLILEAY